MVVLTPTSMFLLSHRSPSGRHSRRHPAAGEQAASVPVARTGWASTKCPPTRHVPLPRSCAGAVPSLSSESPSGVEARSWSPASEGRAQQGLPGKCGEECSSLSGIFRNLPWHQSDSRLSFWTPPQDEESSVTQRAEHRRPEGCQAAGEEPVMEQGAAGRLRPGKVGPPPGDSRQGHQVAPVLTEER